MKLFSFDAKVVEKRKLIADVIILSLSAPDDFVFKAGQFITLFIEKDGEKKPRSYSILNPPSQKGKIDLCIKLVEDGFASDIFRKAKKGDTFLVKGPLGHFVFEETEKEVWFIAGGTGVAPFYSMLKEYLSMGKFTLIFGVKSKKDLFLHDEFVSLEKKDKNFTYIPTLSREEWEGLSGRVQKHLPEDLTGKVFYICGLKELVLETKELLLEKGVDRSDIKVERYS
ncbi:hypothetical protein COV20_04700 [Candidatus Woesearchaeota archaeon CG10_big_fil_rev_8_21_14_0_10_45_16]|nr:MAG: hypothetical protein COV20_04700 [Candidatus Woesearchaeota archaeon CG10_big_fil_rev_8_21_14_0_10_45_16]